MLKTSPGTLRPFNQFLLLSNLEKDLSPEQLVTVKLRNKGPHVWINYKNHKSTASDTNARLSFTCCFPILCLFAVEVCGCQMAK